MHQHFAVLLLERPQVDVSDALGEEILQVLVTVAPDRLLQLVLPVVVLPLPVVQLGTQPLLLGDEDRLRRVLVGRFKGEELLGGR